MDSELHFHRQVVWGVIAFGLISAFALLFVVAPYGRHVRKGWGPTLPNALGWVVMESPAVLFFLGVYFRGENALALAPLCLCGLFQLHYVPRTFIYPFRIRTKGKRMPVVVVLMAICFNIPNAYVNARWLSHFGDYPASWLLDPRFVVGAAIFVVGFGINQLADSTLIALRRGGDGSYKVPQGGLYKWISCPNYLGEILEWAGFALACWSFAALAFFVFTLCNLVPRAVANHRWYRQTFSDYPSDRRALVPFLF